MDHVMSAWKLSPLKICEDTEMDLLADFVSWQNGSVMCISHQRKQKGPQI